MCVCVCVRGTYVGMYSRYVGMYCVLQVAYCIRITCPPTSRTRWRDTVGPDMTVAHLPAHLRLAQPSPAQLATRATKLAKKRKGTYIPTYRALSRLSTRGLPHRGPEQAAFHQRATAPLSMSNLSSSVAAATAAAPPSPPTTTFLATDVSKSQQGSQGPPRGGGRCSLTGLG